MIEKVANKPYALYNEYSKMSLAYRVGKWSVKKELKKKKNSPEDMCDKG